MQDKGNRHIVRKYFMVGILFGLLFPIAGTFIQIQQLEGPISSVNLLDIHLQSPLLLLIDLAPFILGLTALRIGKKQAQLQGLSSSLSLSNKKKDLSLENLYEVLKAKNNDINQMTYVTTHDLKSTLRGISSLITFIHEEDDETEKQNYFNLLKGRINRMENLLSSMLEYLRTSQQTNERNEFVLTQMIEEIKPNFQKCSINNQIIHDIVVQTDLNKLRRVFSELIENSIKFNPDIEPIITLSSEHRGSYVSIFYEDNGIGISAEYSKKVFDIFSTLERKDETENIGLGLALVKKIMSDLGGDISLIEADGAKFELKIPLNKNYDG